jgi:hypothetical protein
LVCGFVSFVYLSAGGSCRLAVDETLHRRFKVQPVKIPMIIMSTTHARSGVLTMGIAGLFDLPAGESLSACELTKKALTAASITIDQNRHDHYVENV